MDPLTVTRHLLKHYAAADGSYLGAFRVDEVTRPVKTGDKTETRRVPVTRKMMRPRARLEKTADGQAFRRVVEERETVEQVVDVMPLVDDDGEPVIHEDKPVMVAVPRETEETVVVGASYERRTEIRAVDPVPADALEVPRAPTDPTERWNGTAWVKP